MDHFRANKRWQPEEEVPEPDPDESTSAEHGALQSIGQKTMLELIEDLSPEQQQVLTLKFVFNFANAEAATILGKTEGAIKSLQHRALVSLQKQLEKREASEASAAWRSKSASSARPAAGRRRSSPRLTRTGGGEYGKTNVGMAPIADARLDALAQVVSARKITPATIRVQDVPGAGEAQLGNLRQVDALLVVLAGFGAGADPAGDLETFKLELLVADRDHVERRLERVEKQAKSGDAKLRAEVEELKKVLAHVDAGGALIDYAGELPPELEPLTTKPMIAVENGPGGIDLKLEAELAELPDDEAAAYRDGGESALDEIAGRLRDALDLITFFTAGEKETRAWTLRQGETALDAADSIHSDIARGFIRCEVVDWQDLVDAGSHAEVSKQGKQRLEGKTYVVRDGDVLNIRFNV